MSEQNILNPDATSLLGPDWPISEVEGDNYDRFQADSGEEYVRRRQAQGVRYELVWSGRQFATYHQLKQWHAQNRADFFSLQDVDRARYFSGRFVGEPTYERVGNERVNIHAVFHAIPGLPLFAYPTNWSRDAIFLEERDGLGADLVKLTGTWVRRTLNYIIHSEAIDNAAWVKNQVTVAANTQTDPLGGSTADRATPTGGATNCYVYQNAGAQVSSIAGKQVAFSIWLKAASGTPSVDLAISNQGGSNRGVISAALTTSWQRFTVSGVMAVSDTEIRCAIGTGNSWPEADGAIDIWGGQLEYGSAASPYVATTAAAAELSAPGPQTEPHGGFAYWNDGTTTTGTAEWQYFGYGFRLWAPKGPDQGILAVSLDGGAETLVDLYNAAMVNSAAVHTDANQKLGVHRVKVRSTNTKNASSSAKYITADAIEVMQ